MKRTLLIIHDIVFLLMGLLFMIIGTFAEIKAGMYDVDGWLVFFAGIIGVRVYTDSLKGSEKPRNYTVSITPSATITQD